MSRNSQPFNGECYEHVSPEMEDSNFNFEMVNVSQGKQGVHRVPRLTVVQEVCRDSSCNPGPSAAPQSHMLGLQLIVRLRTQRQGLAYNLAHLIHVLWS